MTTIFQLTVVHNEEDSGDHVEEFIARAQGWGLKVVDAYQLPDCHWLENWVVLQGTKDQFMSWGVDEQGGGPSFNEEELMEDMIEVEG
jgi:hypothetical protein